MDSTKPAVSAPESEHLLHRKAADWARMLVVSAQLLAMVSGNEKEAPKEQ